MIKINFFNQSIIEEYYKWFINESNAHENDEYTIQFLELQNISYSIPLKKLLCADRNSVLSHAGIKIYELICRCASCINVSDTLPKINRKINRAFSLKTPFIEDSNRDGLNYIYEELEKHIGIQILKKYELTLGISKNNFAKAIKKIKKECCVIKPSNPNIQIDYDKLTKDYRHKLISSLKTHCCPYCNRQYITSWCDDLSEHTTSDLDHFYPKSIYELFSLSLFNFIPSCQICNSRQKLNKVSDILYPYEEGMGHEIRFRVEPNQKNGSEDESDISSLLINLFLGKNNSIYPISSSESVDIYKDFKLIIDTENADSCIRGKANNSITMFNLEALYKNHLDEALKIIFIIRMYLDGSYSKSREDIWKKIHSQGNSSTNSEKGNFSESELRSILLGFSIDDRSDMDWPLSKLKHDIYDQEIQALNTNK